MNVNAVKRVQNHAFAANMVVAPRGGLKIVVDI